MGPLDQINTSNVDQIGLSWSFETGTNRGHETTPIVKDGVMFITAPWSVVHALDAKTGDLLWTHDPKVERAWANNACCDVVNRGVATPLLTTSQQALFAHARSTFGS